MRYTLNSLVKDFSPPILLRGAKVILKLIRGFIEVSEKSPKWYDHTFVKYDSKHKHYTESHFYPIWSVIAELITMADIDSILEIGCGSGQMALLLRDRGVKKYYGFDFSQKRIDWARKTCPGFTFIVADALKTDLFEKVHYDAVVCTDFLTHIIRDIEVITRIRPGTRFYGTVPNYPYTSHVRYFRTSNEVYSRYVKYFKNFRIVPFLADVKGKTIYLIEGVKL